MPSQKQLHWSELRVGITVVVAAITLAVLIFLMTSAQGLFTRKLQFRVYFDNAEGLRNGAPVRLQGVDVGNVTRVRVVPEHMPLPVEVTLKVSSRYEDAIHKDSVASLATAGVLGETFVDIDSLHATGPKAQDNDELKAENAPGISDVVRASNTTLQNVNKIVDAIQQGKGSIGKFIYDPSLFNKLNDTVTEAQGMVKEVRRGHGTIGKLISDDELYKKLNATVEKLNKIVDAIDRGEGTAGKLIKDPSLYNNANQTVAKVNALMDDVNAGKGALGKFAKDEEFARKLDNTMTRLSNLATKLDQGEGTAGKLFKDPSLYNNADQMLVETRNLVKAIRENPKKYLTIHFKLF
jgi:phospholipid/cholesterol/gamma-HCH transport system substrate-binding protein